MFTGRLAHTEFVDSMALLAFCLHLFSLVGCVVTQITLLRVCLTVVLQSSRQRAPITRRGRVVATLETT